MSPSRHAFYAFSLSGLALTFAAIVAPHVGAADWLVQTLRGLWLAAILAAAYFGSRDKKRHGKRADVEPEE